VHEGRRLPALRRLAALRPPELTAASVAAVRAELEAVAEAEAEAAGTGYRGVTAAQEAADGAAEEVREALRRELHRFAALAPASGLASVSSDLREEVLEDPGAEELFRRGGALKGELELLASRAGSDEVVYAMPLQVATERCEMLVASLTLGDALEAQGKGPDREALAATADKMRTARRTELPALVARMQTQTARLAAAEGLEPLVAEELSSCAEALGELCEQCYEALVANRLEVPAALRAVATGEGAAVAAGSRAGSDAGSGGGGGGGAGAAGTVRNRAGSVARKSVARKSRAGSVGRKSQASGAGRSAKSGRSKRSRGSRGSGSAGLGDDAKSTVIGQALPMAELRALQRRVGMLVVACELPDDAKDVLRRALDALAAQEVANGAVDEAVGAELGPLLDRRRDEGAGLCARVAASLERQSRALEAAGVNLCRLWARLARSELRHETREQAVNHGASDDLNALLDAFEDAAAGREADFSRLSKLCRHSPDEDELAERFEAVGACLDGIEAGYRGYHAEATARAGRHPVEAAANLRRHRRALCELLGLRFPGAERIDGAPAAAAPGAEAASEPAPEDSGAEAAASTAAAGDTTSPDEAGAAAGREPPMVPPLAGLGAALLESVRAEADDGVSPRSARPAPTDDGALLAEAEGPTPTCTLEEAAEAGWATLEVAPAEAGDVPVGATLRFEGASLETKEAEGEEAGDGAGAGGDAAAVYAAEVDASSLASALVVTRRETEAEMQSRKREEEAEAERSAGAEEREAEERAAREAEEAEAAAAAAGKGGKKKAKAPPAKKDQGKKGKKGAEEEAPASEWPGPAGEDEEREWEASARQAMEDEDDAGAARRVADAAAAVYTKGVEDSRGVPLSPSGEPLVLWCEVPAAEATDWVSGLRLALLRRFEAHARSRRVRVAEQCEDREAMYTAELAERVRLHRPRKAMAETELRAPREAELLAHAQRLERHCRAWRERAEKQGRAFDREGQAARDHTAAFRDRLSALQGSLTAQASLAALQGQQNRAKALLVSFETEAQGWRSRLGSYAGAEPGRLLTLNREFLRTCSRFAEGGEYDDAEVRDVRDALAGMEGELSSDVERRRGAAEEVAAAQREAAAAMEGFAAAFDEALRALSMREGLGKKFGAPRRQCTERLRTVLGWSDVEERRVGSRLDELEGLVEEGAAASTRLREREREAAEEAERARRAGAPGASHERVDAAAAAADAARRDAEASAARGSGLAAMLEAASVLPARTPYAAGEDAEEEEATVRLMVRGCTLREARGKATAYVRRMRKRKRAEAGEGDGDSTEEEGGTDGEGDGDDGVTAGGASSARSGAVALPPAPLDGLAPRDPASGMMAPAASPAAPSLSARIRYCMAVLRESLEHRARYLEALKPAMRALDPCGDLNLCDEPPPAPPGGSPADSAAASAEASPRGKGKGKPDAKAAKATKAAAEAAVAAEADAAAGAGEEGGERLSAQVDEALRRCRAATRELFEAEGEPLEDGDAGLPQSLRDYLEREGERCEGARLDACRRLRETVGRAWRLLSEAPSVAVADAAARSARYSDDAAAWARSRFRGAARALVEVREAHTAALVPGLGDPNRAAELDALDAEEVRRCEEHAGAVAAGRARELAARRAGAEVLRRRVLHCAAWCLRATDATVVAEDLAALPGDEEAAPSKLGLRRLRKQLRRDRAERDAADAEAGKEAAAAADAAPAGKKKAAAGKKGKGGGAAADEEAEAAAKAAAVAAAAKTAAEAAGGLMPPEGPGTDVDGAGVPTRAYKRRRWPALVPVPSDLLALPAPPGEWAAASQADAEEAVAARVRATADSGLVVSLYSESSRHTARTRDAAWRALGEGSRAVSAETDRWYGGLHSSVLRWQAHWSSLTASLRAEAEHVQGADEA